MADSAYDAVIIGQGRRLSTPCGRYGGMVAVFESTRQAEAGAATKGRSRASSSITIASA
jgi:hypothetical protein